MSCWVSQPGYPVLFVKVEKDRKLVEITQTRFLHTNPNHQDQTQWNIPITYASDKINTEFSNTKPFIIFTNKSLQIELNDTIDWIVFNVKQSGECDVKHARRIQSNIFCGAMTLSCECKIDNILM